jgi:hypothetical protein
MESVHLHMEESNTKQTRGLCREYWTTFLLFFCIALIVTAIFVGSFGLAKGNQVQAQIENELSLRDEIARHDAESLPFMGHSIALSEAYKSGKPRILSLCMMASYYHETNASFLVALDKEATRIDTLTESPMKDYAFYHVSARLRLTFTELLKKKKLKTTGVLSEAKKKAILLEYNVTSNFATFSTVKLQELEFDTRRHSLSALRTIVLCSNNPYAIAQRCDETVSSSSSLLLLHGEEELSFHIPLIGDRKNPIDEADDEEEAMAFSSEILGIRMYNLVFYSAVDNHRHVTNTTAIYEERKLLTIEPTKCH